MELSGLEIAFRLFAVAGLVLLNGFFVASEFAIVTVRKTRLEQLAAEGNRAARAALAGTKDTDSFVAACQLGITMASLALGWIGEPALASVLEPLFFFLPHEGAVITGHVVATVLTFAVITFLHMILGEQVPKVMALQDAERLALFVAAPTLWFGRVFRPFIWLVNWSTDTILGFFGMTAPEGHRAVHSVDELRVLVVQSSRAGVLEEGESAIAQRAFELGDLSARDVMVPRTEMVALPVTLDLKGLMDHVVEHSHSRFPIYQGSVDNIIGVVHVIDLVRATQSGGVDFNVRRIMRQPLFVPETLASHQLLELMRGQKRHLAIVVDEFGGTSGLVTLEDIVERLIGPVQDEQVAPEVTRLELQEDGSFLVSGLVNLTELSDAIGVEVESEDYSTIGGYVFGILGRRPQVGDEVENKLMSARVETLDGLRIAQVRVTPRRPAEVASED